jgi:hypothetical protein
MTKSILNAERVREIFVACLFKDGESQAKFVEAQGVVHTFGFHPGRVHEYRDEIATLLNELPDTFHEEHGGGWSFLNACMDKHGNHWAEQPTVEQLLVLGIATDKVAYCLPRDMWAVLPGGVPYFMVKK